ncbi:hypothetical protein JCGZ_19027 [Jatropha curcas]|uniref:Transmembrane protein n=1 Tax=Jatropha curcas TaxID=180498 RepID=A0A067JVN1_JATCU|nr:uncharacterized protein LOC105643567 [Jatropha curcas]KDP27947.1 hypothetical protein JCGZ_19027 [Jatropha curcas]
MDYKDGDFDVDLENGLRVNAEDPHKDYISVVKIQAKELLGKIYGVFVDGTINDEEGLNLCHNAPSSNGVSVEQVKLEGEKTVDHAEKKVVKEKRKKMSNKKASKPPRPPTGPTLDAADQKLIKELTELAMLKRAKVERMKALKKMKAAKASSSNSNTIAMVFTVLFCLVIVFQGMSSRVASVNLPGSPVSIETVESGLITVQFFGNPSASNQPGSGSPNSIKPIAGHDSPEI